MRVFFDTNILVYMFDADSPVKKTTACRLLETEAAAGRAFLSTQVLQEFYVVTTKKLAVPLPPEAAEDAVRNLLTLPVIGINGESIVSAIKRSQAIQISFWDALIVGAAISGGAVRLLTEDMQHGQVIEGLEIENPFLPF